MAVKFPSDMDTTLDTEGDDFDSDYDPTEEGHIDHQGSVCDVPTHPFPERALVIKAYLVKYTYCRQGSPYHAGMHHFLSSVVEARHEQLASREIAASKLCVYASRCK